ncbi:MAG TPA: hypothetical protein VF493_18210, partial [Terriglobales bacterium]
MAIGATPIGQRTRPGPPLRVDVDDGAASDLPFEHSRGDDGHVCEVDDLGCASEFAQFLIARESRLGLDAGLVRGIDGVDAGMGHVAQDEGQDGLGKIRS